MTRKWINSADVEVSAAGAVLTDAAGCSSMVGGTKIVALAATPEKLVANPTPCRRVRIMSRVDANGLPLNTKPCFVGDSAGQNIPVMVSNYEGVIVPIDDASKVYVKAGANGEGVNYRIFV